MGLAQAKNKQKIGLDPRNTHWANDHSQFGHRHLARLGWQPGSGLGLQESGNSTHVKVVYRNSNAGLGARNPQNPDADDDGPTTGLDAFQQLLGRLNGREEEVSKHINQRKVDVYCASRFGMTFVKGACLEGTIEREIISADKDIIREKSTAKKEKRSKKRKLDENSEKIIKVSSKHAKRSKDDKEDIEKKKKKKRDKKNSKEEKRQAKSKEVAFSSEKISITPQSQSDDNNTPPPPPVSGSRLSHRAKFLSAKRRATMDPQSLREIFMIKS